MRSMVINRRQFIGFGIGTALLGPMHIIAQENTQKLISCRSNEQGEHFFSIAETGREQLINIPLPARGHGITVDASQSYVAVFARRPGEFVYIVDLRNHQVIHRVSAKQGRHFNGHGLFAADGSKLLCSENAYDTGAGIIGVYDAYNNYQRIAEFQSYGLDPHEFKLLSDGNTLVIANGGILTHPDLPRIKQNLESMRPNLAYVDMASGRLLHAHQPDEKLHQLSIRHIDISRDDRVAIAMQFEGKPNIQPPLIAIQQADQPMNMLAAPTDVHRRLRNYCGSVAFSADGTRFAVSSPRGGIVTFWSAGGDYLGLYDQADACGISHATNENNDFYISDGSGTIARVDHGMSSTMQYKFNDSRWDNHLLTLSIA
jgi:uncharacterized protein